MTTSSRPYALRRPVVLSATLAVAVALAASAGCRGTEPAGAEPAVPASASAAAARLLPLPADAPIRTIAFGSCARSDRDQTIWDAIVAQDPDVFLFVGDNVYVDIPDPPRGPEDFAVKYAQLAAQPGWQKLTAVAPVLATLDDHDFGLNDAGKDFPLKHVAKDHFVDFFEVPADHPMRSRPGIYHATTVGPPGQRVQFILLDTRTFRDPITRHPNGRESRPDGTRYGPYTPNPDGQGTLLGDAQWRWLEQQLREPADVRVVASSIQVVAHEHRWESWGNFPHERRRLYDLIDATDAHGVVFVSGDRHLIEISRDTDAGTPYPMWDFTSSGFNWSRRDIPEPNRFRVGPMTREPNFGVIHLDWSGDTPTLTLVGRNGAGEKLTHATVAVGELR